jgi:mannitol-1-phosphate/altronate dehydrogenase
MLLEGKQRDSDPLSLLADTEVFGLLLADEHFVRAVRRAVGRIQEKGARMVVDEELCSRKEQS